MTFILVMGQCWL